MDPSRDDVIAALVEMEAWLDYASQSTEPEDARTVEAVTILVQNAQESIAADIVERVLSAEPRRLVLRIPFEAADTGYLTDALGEFARDLEAHEADGDEPPLGLIPDPDDPGRYAWEIVEERYPGIGE